MNAHFLNTARHGLTGNRPSLSQMDNARPAVNDDTCPTCDAHSNKQQKNKLLQALLYGQHFTNALVLGCADGALSLQLAQQCTRLLCCDASQQIVQASKRQLNDFRHVRIERRRVPLQWPEGSFDLIVLNETCNQLDINDTRRLVMRARMALASHGTLIACHSRTPVNYMTNACMTDVGMSSEKNVQQGDALHHHLHAGLLLPRVASHRLDNLMIDMWRVNATGIPM